MFLVLVLLFFVCVGTYEVFLIPHTTSNQFLSIFQSPHCIHMRSGVKFGDASLTDTMLKDGLWDAFNDYHMGITAENVAKQFDITREQQDEFAALSQNKAESAQKSDVFKPEITPVTIQSRKGMLVLLSQWNLSTRDKLGMGPLFPDSCTWRYTVKPLLKDTPKEDKPPNKCTLVYTLCTK